MTTEPAAMPATPYDPATAGAPPARSKKLGRVAMLLGVGVFVVSLIASALMGAAAAPYAAVGSGGFNVNLNMSSSDPTETALALAALLHVGLGTLIGISAIVFGIIAIATKRGRGAGIVAVIFAALAPGLSLAIYLGTAISLAHPSY